MENSIITPNFSEVAAEVPRAPKEMLSVSDVSGVTEVRINSSSLSVIQSCLRKARYSLLEGRRSKGESPALTFGTAVHKALEVFYLTPIKERALPADFEAVARHLAAGGDAPYPHPLFDALKAFMKTAEPLQTLPDTDTQSIVSGVWVLGHYFSVYQHDVYETYVDAAGPFVERKFEFVLNETPNLRVVLFGTIDLVLRNAVSGELLVTDHKTTSRLGSDFYNRLKPNHQYTGYLMGAQQVFGLRTENFLVNALQKKSKPVTPRGGPPSFARQVTSRSPEDMAEFREVVLHNVMTYLLARDTGIWPLGSPDSCTQWGGCTYLDVCSAPAALRKNILESRFQ